MPVRLVFDPQSDPQHKLRPGLNVSVSVDTVNVDAVNDEPIDKSPIDKSPSTKPTSTIKP